MPAPARIPFVLKRPFLLLRDALVNRDRPRLEELSALSNPEVFVWRILPHAARTFSACIVMLPYRVALASAVAYLYCRILDTCEDLIPTADERDAALQEFADRLQPGIEPPETAPTIDPGLARDARDAAHILLVNRCTMVDRMFVTLDMKVQTIICELLSEMSAGMRWSSRTFADQQGSLQDDSQLSRYCYGVLGTTIIFSARLFSMRRGGMTEISDAVRADAIAAGEFLQLANITRDIEKDLKHGVAYHPLLADHVGQDPVPDAALTETVARVRSLLLDRALSFTPAYRRLVDGLPLGGLSLHRASAVLMMLFCERYYLKCAARCGRVSSERLASGFTTIWRAFPAFWSHRAADRILKSSEANLLQLTHPRSPGDPSPTARVQEPALPPVPPA